MSIKEVKLFATDDGKVFEKRVDAICHDAKLKKIEAYEMTGFSNYMAFSEFTTALEIDFEYVEKMLQNLKNNS